MPAMLMAASRRRTVVVAAALAAIGLVASCTGPPPVPPPWETPLDHTVVNTTDGSGRGTLTVDGCELLGTDSVFTQRIDQLPAETFAPGTDPIESARGKLDLVGKNKFRTGARDGPGYNGLIFAMQLNTVVNSTRELTIGVFTHNVPKPVTVLFPPNDGDVRWEGMPASASENIDAHLFVLGTDPCRLQEHISFKNVLFTTAAGVEWDLPIRRFSTPLLEDDHGNPVPMDVDGARLPITPLVYRFDEVVDSSAPISHALRIIFPNDIISSTSVWPAGKSDGKGDPNEAALPMGSRLRLKSTSLDRLKQTATPEASKVLDALHDYGAVVADSSGPTTSSGSHGFGLNGDYNPDWPAGMTDDFPDVVVEDFELVDTSCWQRSDSNHLAVKSGTLPSSC